MKWRQIENRLRKIHYSPGERSSERVIWNCPCLNKAHPVSVGLHPSKEAYPFDLKRQLGPHLKQFGHV